MSVDFSGAEDAQKMFDFTEVEGRVRHPEVVECHRTCFACPEQYEGKFRDGRFFYFRYRHGSARLSAGESLEAAHRTGSPYSVNSAKTGQVAYLDIGGDLQGIFDSPEQRDEVFARLYQNLSEVSW